MKKHKKCSITLLVFTASTVTQSSTPYHHINFFYDLGQNIILQYAKKIKANINTNSIPLINSIIFQNVSIPLTKTQHHFYSVYRVNAKYILLLTKSDVSAVPIHLLQNIIAKIEPFIFITISPLPFVIKDAKIHPAN